MKYFVKTQNINEKFLISIKKHLKNIGWVECNNELQSSCCIFYHLDYIPEETRTLPLTYAIFIDCDIFAVKEFVKNSMCQNYVVMSENSSQKISIFKKNLTIVNAKNLTKFIKEKSEDVFGDVQTNSCIGMYIFDTKDLEFNIKDYKEFLTKKELVHIEEMYRSKKNQNNALASKLLQRYSCVKHTGLKNSSLIFRDETKYGKPFCKNAEANNFHYNISHTANYTCIAFHNKPIGLDIQIQNQKIQKIVESKFSKVFNSIEMYTFFWTKIESFLKYSGKGLTKYEQLSYSDVENTENNYHNISDYLPPEIHGCICSNQKSDIIVKNINLKKIITTLISSEKIPQAQVY